MWLAQFTTDRVLLDGCLSPIIMNSIRLEPTESIAVLVGLMHWADRSSLAAQYIANSDVLHQLRHAIQIVRPSKPSLEKSDYIV